MAKAPNARRSLSHVTETGLRMCRPEKGRQIDAIRSRAVRFPPVHFANGISRNTGMFCVFSLQKAGQFLCSLDLLAERERFEPSVQLSSARHYREHREVKPSSQSLRFVIANNSPTQVCKVGPLLGSWRKKRDRMPCRYSAAVFSARVVRETIAKYGQFLLFCRRFGEISLRARLNGSANGNRTRV
jgi:hypothetical protein